MSAPSEPAGVLWVTASFEDGGHADEARHLILSLRAAGIGVAAQALDDGRVDPDGRSGPSAEELRRAVAQRCCGAPVLVEHFAGGAFHRLAGARRYVGRTGLGTWAVPPSWVERLNEMDEVWVPSEFNVDTFERSGVTVPVVVVPRGVDAELFRPTPAPARSGPAGTRFVSVGGWSPRHGWDVLLGAWVDAFGPSDPVTLHLHHLGAEPETIDAVLAGMGRSRRDAAPITTTTGDLTEPALAVLLGSAHAYVGPTRGDAWGRPILEAMACGLPVIATRWGAAPSLLDDACGLLLEIDGIESAVDVEDATGLDGQWWAQPSRSHLAELLRRVADDADGADALGRAARSAVQDRWTWAHAAAAAGERLAVLGVPTGPPASSPGATTTRVRWVGDQFAHHSLALVNRELCGRIAELPTVSLEVATREDWSAGLAASPHLDPLARRIAPALDGPPDVEVRHQWPPVWSAPAHGAWVVIQPWEYGGIPQEWLDRLGDVDEIWCPSEFVRSCYILSGVAPAKVRVVPNGVDLTLFDAEGVTYPVASSARTKFLFVGGTILRKGIDVLLEAYTRTFGAGDDVCLVVKSTLGESFYRGQTHDAVIRNLAATPGGPEIELIDADLEPADVAALYRACDALVHPYRGEGFALPVAEAMACGLPVAVTAYGACLDYCDDASAYLVPARVQPITLEQASPLGAWWAEPDVGALGAVMRRIHEQPEEARRRGAAGRDRVRAQLPWDAAAAVAAQRLAELGRRRPIRMRAAATPPFVPVPAA